ncbi:MAG: hypothetical protein QOC59_311 [Microbacteriaceae bacterium]|nr:hypothetical protein [Microbacteriaceae bacterium]
MVTAAIPPTCDFVDCDEAATGRYLDAGHDRAVEFGVCSAHFARITGGERPVIVMEQPDQPESDDRPTLSFE